MQQKSGVSIQNYSDILENYSLDFFNEDQLTQLPKKIDWLMTFNLQIKRLKESIC